MRTWCCNKLKENITITVDSQDIDELYDGKCPYCKNTAKIGKSCPKGRKLSLEEAFDFANETWPIPKY